MSMIGSSYKETSRLDEQLFRLKFYVECVNEIVLKILISDNRTDIDNYIDYIIKTCNNIHHLNKYGLTKDYLINYCYNGYYKPTCSRDYKAKAIFDKIDTNRFNVQNLYENVEIITKRFCDWYCGRLIKTSRVNKNEIREKLIEILKDYKLLVDCNTTKEEMNFIDEIT